KTAHRGQREQERGRVEPEIARAAEHPREQQCQRGQARHAMHMAERGAASPPIAVHSQPETESGGAQKENQCGSSHGSQSASIRRTMLTANSPAMLEFKQCSCASIQ